MWHKIKTVGTLSEFTKTNAAVVPLMQAPENHDGIITSLYHFFSNPTQAVGDKTYDMIHPFLEIFSIMAYPISAIVFVSAGLFFMMGYRDKSVSLMIKTGIIYTVVQMLPFIVKTAINSIVSF
jgi:hypothetical protein